MYKILAKAQETYGYPNQVMVAVEELMELGQVLSKYPRYNTHTDFCEAVYHGENLREKVIEESADVVICLHHLYMMFNIQPGEQERYIDAKLKRLDRWLNESTSMQQTTIDRDVDLDKESPCKLPHCEFPECNHVCGYTLDKPDYTRLVEEGIAKARDCNNLSGWQPRSESNDPKGV
jgi:hypothetical protein